MRDSSREPAHGLHSARLLQLIFQRSPFGDIDDDAFHQRVTFASGHKNGVVAHPDGPAIFALQAVLRLIALGFPEALFGSLEDRIIFFRDVKNPVLGVGQPFFLRVTQNRFYLRAHVMPFRVRAHFRDIADCGHLFDEHLVLGFGF